MCVVCVWYVCGMCVVCLDMCRTHQDMCVVCVFYDICHVRHTEDTHIVSICVCVLTSLDSSVCVFCVSYVCLLCVFMCVLTSVTPLDARICVTWLDTIIRVTWLDRTSALSWRLHDAVCLNKSDMPPHNLWVLARETRLGTMIRAFSTYDKCLCIVLHISTTHKHYGVATVPTINRLLKFIGLVCKKALYTRLYSAKETYDLKEPTDCSHPISPMNRAYGAQCRFHFWAVLVYGATSCMVQHHVWCNVTYCTTQCIVLHQHHSLVIVLSHHNDCMSRIWKCLSWEYMSQNILWGAYGQ